MVPEVSKPTTLNNPPLAPRKVLLVDEDATDLQYYGNILQWQGYEVRACASYAEAWLALEKAYFDFVIVAQGSREFEGRVLLEQAMLIDRRTPVLVLTDHLDMGCYLEAMQLGAVDYVEKPVLPSEMARLVQTHTRPRPLARAAGAA